MYVVDHFFVWLRECSSITFAARRTASESACCASSFESHPPVPVVVIKPFLLLILATVVSSYSTPLSSQIILSRMASQSIESPKSPTALGQMIDGMMKSSDPHPADGFTLGWDVVVSYSQEEINQNLKKKWEKVNTNDPSTRWYSGRSQVHGTNRWDH